MKKVLSLVLVVLMSLSMFPAFAAEPFETTVDWDAEYDVVVIGYGAAGATAAISAADAGAKVLLLEKAPYGEEGGNSRYAAQLVLAPKDRDAALVYYKNLRGDFNNQTDEVIEGLVDGLCSVRGWLDAHGAEYIDYPFIEYPELEGSECAITVLVNKKSWSGEFYKFLQKKVQENSDKKTASACGTACGASEKPE
ncbi:MAG: FAD-binding protein, partial [Clostridia bacterium]|nr:FAD-binding protein [Clostridia bacterium]